MICRGVGTTIRLNWRQMNPQSLKSMVSQLFSFHREPHWMLLGDWYCWLCYLARRMLSSSRLVRAPTLRSSTASCRGDDQITDRCSFLDADAYTYKYETIDPDGCRAPVRPVTALRWKNEIGFEIRINPNSTSHYFLYASAQNTIHADFRRLW